MNFLMETFSSFRFPHDALDILIVAVVLYNLFLLIRGTRAIQMLLGLTVLLLVYFAAVKIGLHTVSWVLQNFLGAAVLVVIILFQPEFRRVLANVGRAPLLDVPLLPVCGGRQHVQMPHVIRGRAGQRQLR